MEESLTPMAKRKKIERNPKAEMIAKAILEAYKPESTSEMNDAIKDVFGPMFEAMLQGEMDAHLGYKSNDHSGVKGTTNRRNGYIDKTLKTSYGEIDIKSPRDREGTFEPVSIPKRTSDVSGIEDKVISMYARGMSERDIASTIEDIYGFEISHETISNITDKVIDEAKAWQKKDSIPLCLLTVCMCP